MTIRSPEIPVAELIEKIARTLVDKPEEVSVNANPCEQGTPLQPQVDPTDVGKVIGKQGRTATVHSSQGVPAGTVTFSTGETVLGSESLDNSGTAALQCRQRMEPRRMSL
ncbi:MAG: KH domain-containing protein [Acidobacteriaceae bacterium]